MARTSIKVITENRAEDLARAVNECITLEDHDPTSIKFSTCVTLTGVGIYAAMLVWS